MELNKRSKYKKGKENMKIINLFHKTNVVICHQKKFQTYKMKKKGKKHNL
jgi:hypothetical protein